VGRDTPEVFEEARFLMGKFGGLEDEKGGNDSDEGEVIIFRGGHGIVCVRGWLCSVTLVL
jgi:hypothetical protein